MRDFDDSDSFGALLRQWRIAAGLTQEDPAARAGMSARGIQNLERDENRPRRDSLKLLADALDLRGEQRHRFETTAQPLPRGPRGDRNAIAPGLDSRRADPARLTQKSRPLASSGVRPTGATSGEGVSAPAAGSRSNLPIRLDSLVGREADLARLGDLLARNRLITLTGPGGVGKTSLALATAAEHAGEFEAGVFVASLASLADPDLVAATLARALGVRDAPGRPATEAIVEAIDAKQLLFVIDNFEPVVDAAPIVATILGACPGLTALVTSRVVLRLHGEHVYDVDPLPLLDLGSTATPRSGHA